MTRRYSERKLHCQTHDPEVRDVIERLWRVREASILARHELAAAKAELATQKMVAGEGSEVIECLRSAKPIEIEIEADDPVIRTSPIGAPVVIYVNPKKAHR